MLKKILAELHLLLIPDVAHKAVFTNVSIIGLKNDTSLKDQLVRAVSKLIRKVDRNCVGEETFCLVMYVN